MKQLLPAPLCLLLLLLSATASVAQMPALPGMPGEGGGEPVLQAGGGPGDGPGGEPRDQGPGPGGPPPEGMARYAGFALPPSKGGESSGDASSGTRADFEFVTLNVPFFREQEGQEASKIKRPLGDIEIENARYFIVEGKLEIEEGKAEAQGDAQGERRGPRIVSLTGKLSKTRYERADVSGMPGEEPKPGTELTGKPAIAGEIHLRGVDKGPGLRTLHGKAKTPSGEVDLYLLPLPKMERPMRGPGGAGRPEGEGR